MGAAGKDVPVVIVRRSLSGLRVRMLADRDAGQVIWESEYLDDSGAVVDRTERRLKEVELLHLESLLESLLEARKNLTPRRRLDRARLSLPAIAKKGEKPWPST